MSALPGFHKAVALQLSATGQSAATLVSVCKLAIVIITALSLCGLSGQAAG